MRQPHTHNYTNLYVFSCSHLVFAVPRYEVFHRRQFDIVQQYQGMVAGELKEYDDAICKFFAVDRTQPEEDTEKVNKRRIQPIHAYSAQNSKTVLV